MTAGPENCSMKGHKRSSQGLCKGKRWRKTTISFFKSPVFHGNNIKRIKFIYILLIPFGWGLNSHWLFDYFKLSSISLLHRNKLKLFVV